MKTPRPSVHPVMSCAEAREFEKHFFAGDTDDFRALCAMRLAGDGVARETRNLLGEAGASKIPLLVFAGKGRNGGDALLAAASLLPQVSGITVFLAEPMEKLAPETAEVLEELLGNGAVPTGGVVWIPEKTPLPKGPVLILDGLAGAGFRPPLSPVMREMIAAANAHPDALRVAVDMPSGAGDASDELLFKADLTVATGIFKKPLLDSRVRASAGRIRYADIGFFDAIRPETPVSVLGAETKRLSDRLRPAICDKRDFGHVAILGGHRTMPGALLMNVLAALRSGAGLVTVFCPGSVHAAFAAAVPEAMWVPLPETPGGAVGIEALPLILQKLSRAGALVCGSGMGDAPETTELLVALVGRPTPPLVLDADALRPSVIEAVAARRESAPPAVLTPHDGEFLRISGNLSGDGFETLNGFARNNRVLLLQKGPLTRISDGERGIIIPHGGPILARGGSGDMLAGILGTALARADRIDIETIAAAAGLFGAAADHIAALRGADHLRSTEILDGLSPMRRA